MSKLWKPLLVIILVLFIASLSGCLGCCNLAGSANDDNYVIDNEDNSGPAPGYSTYTDPNYYYSIDYPDEWELDESKEDIAQFVSPSDDSSDFTESVNVIYSSDTGGMSLSELTTKNIEQIENKYPSYNQLEKKKINVDGYDAYRVVYTVTLNGGDYKVQQVFLLAKGTFFVITYTSEKSGYSNYINQVNVMMDSFQVE